MPEVRNAITKALADGLYVKLTDSINALADVTISGVAVGHSLYNDGAGQWKNTNSLLNDVASNQLTYTGQLIRVNDNHASTANRIWLQIYNKDSVLRFEVGSVSNGNPQIRFNVIGNTRIGFPASDPTYFAFINDYSDFWLANSGDATMYFNYYNGTAMALGSTGNRQTITAYILASGTGFIFNGAGGSVQFQNGVNIAFQTGTGTKIGTATAQKLGFWNVTPVVQQVLATGAGATVDNVISLLQTLGLCKQS